MDSLRHFADTFSRPRALGGGVAALAVLPEEQQQQQEVDLAAAQLTGATASGDDADAADTDTDAGAGATADGNADAQPERSPPRFLVNYESEGDFFAGGTGSGPGSSQQANTIPESASGYGFPQTLNFGNLNRFPTPNQHQQQQQYFFK